MRGVEGELWGLVGGGADVVVCGLGGEVRGCEAEVAEDEGWVFWVLFAAAGGTGGEFEEDVVGFYVSVDDGAPVLGWGMIGLGAVDAGVQEGEGGGERD